MTIDYIKLSPTGNITVLVKTPVPRERQAAVAARLLADDRVGGEQAGFIEASSDPRAATRLQMMGGEFCGNATMSLGAYLARRDGACVADSLIEVSGCPEPVPCRILRDGDGWVGTVGVPPARRIRDIGLTTDGGTIAVPLVEMPGISHLVIPAWAGLSEDELRRRIRAWNDEIGADALGALVWDEAAMSIDPLVYVPSAGTLVREHGCGSGTAAVGCMLAAARGQGLEVPVRQPGGTITARVEVRNGAIASVAITGRVTVVAEGTVELEAFYL